MDIKEKINNFPEKPGIYLFKDDAGKVIYIGKAKSLKKRVSSYFIKGRGYHAKIQALVSNIKDADYVLTGSEAKALIFEQAMIKEYMPRYNSLLRDDKRYPSLKVTLNEDFPRIFITRKRKPDGARYFGPYTSGYLLKQALKLIKEQFHLRICRHLPRHACLNYHLGLCPAPCIGKINKEDYGKIVDQVIMFLEARQDDLVKSLNEKMVKLSGERKFEDAALARDQIRSLTDVLYSQKGLEKRLPNVKFGPDEQALIGLAREVGLKVYPKRIAAFDISNISGKEAVGSMICFVDGAPAKNEYKRFRIKTVMGISDYDMMREVVSRAFKRAGQENWPMPQLVIIDGGRGHLNAALNELNKLRIFGVEVIAIAKEFEQVFSPHKALPISLAKNSPALHLLQRIRDEAHRFAISYHRLLKEKQMSASVLDDIDGIGPKRKQALIKYFGSLEKIKRANFEKLIEVPGINKNAAEEIIRFFKKLH